MNYTETSANCFHYSFFTSLSITPDYIPFLPLFPSSFLSFLPSHLLSYTFYISIHDLLLAAENLERDTASKNLHLPYQRVH